jgi:hypothetical protein
MLLRAETGDQPIIAGGFTGVNIGMYAKVMERIPYTSSL